MNESSLSTATLAGTSSFHVGTILPPSSEPTPELSGQPKQAASQDSTLDNDHIDAYERRTGFPLVVDLLDIKASYRQLGIDQPVQAINEYLLGELHDRNLSPTESTYGQLYHELRDQLGLDSNLNFDEAVEKMEVWVRYQNENKIRKQMKEMLAR